jgi:hypothetical protein
MLKFLGRARAPRSAALGLAVAAVLGGLAGCGDNFPEMVAQRHAQVTARVKQLGTFLDAGRVRNANIIKQYAALVERQRPAVLRLTRELAREGATTGLAFGSLGQRLARVNRSPSDEKQAGAAFEDLQRIEAAADPVVFNDSLIDVVNVLADLSNGKLPRMQVPPSETKSAKGAGSHLVGNPRYGQWRQNSSGQSFWAFYGQYAMMRSLFFSPRPYYYSSWYGNRGWSYYGDVGRHYYGGRADSARWSQARKAYPNTRPRRSYGRLRSQRRLSTYGQSASRAPGGALKRASSYGSSARGTSRGATRRTSRTSSFRGK